MKTCANILLAGLLAGSLNLHAAETPKAADWPNWRGPYCNGSAVDCGQELIEDLAQAKLVWTSDAHIPQAHKYPGGRMPTGGYAEPILADGRLYQFYLEPDLRVIPKKWTEFHKRHGIRDCTEEEARANGAIFASDVIVCLDARTGKTLWKAVFAGKGYNHWYPSPQCVPCYEQGKVFVLGSAGLVYCLDAKTGEPLWETSLGLPWHVYERIKDYGERHQELSHHGCGPFTTSVVTAGGVVVVNDNWNLSFVSGFKMGRFIPELSPGSLSDRGMHGLMGFDPATGRRLWRVPECVDSINSPVRWTYHGKEYVLAGATGNEKLKVKSHLVCVDPQTGQLVWDYNEPFTCQCTVSVTEEYVVANGGVAKENSGNYTKGYECLKITPQGATKAWTMGGETRSGIACCSPVLHHGRAFFNAGAAELEGGKFLGKSASSAYTPMIASDGRVFVGGQMFAAETLKPMGQLLKGTSLSDCTSGLIVQGRWYFRTDKNVVCYDLRKSPPADSGAKSDAATAPAGDVPGWLKQLESPYLSVRQAALDALSKSGVASLRPAVPGLVQLLKTGEWPARSAAAQVLGCLGPAGVEACLTELRPALGAALEKGSWGEVELLAGLAVRLAPADGGGMAADLIKHLESGALRAKAIACHGLAVLGPAAAPATAPLAKLAEGENPDLARWACMALQAIGPKAEDAAPALARLLSSKDPELAFHALRGLYLLGPASKVAAPAMTEAVGKLALPGKNAGTRGSPTGMASELLTFYAIECLANWGRDNANKPLQDAVRRLKGQQPTGEDDDKGGVDKM